MKIFVAMTLVALTFAGCASNELPDAAVVAVEYGSQPGAKWNHAVSEDRVAFSVAETPTAALYDVAPEAATLHDLLESWSYDYGTYNGSVSEYGFFLHDINGVAGFHDDAGTPDNYDDDFGAFWQVFVNGEASQTGISSTLAENGMVVKFVYTTY